jgi:hypothetical protein
MGSSIIEYKFAQDIAALKFILVLIVVSIFYTYSTYLDSKALYYSLELLI